jgi:predicted Zn-dependent protease
MKKATFFALSLILLTACTSVLITGRKQLLLVSDKEVIASSATAYKQFIDSVPTSADTVKSALVKKVGNNIATAVVSYLKSKGLESEAASFAWEFNLIKDTTANAFCMPGGKVAVFEGILPFTQTEAGLAVVVGHEIAHAVAKHSNERLSQQLLAQYGATLTDILASNKPAATRQTINVLYGLGAQVGVILPYSRQHEYEADKLGLIFMAMAGYDPNEAVYFWERMSKLGSGSMFEFMSTHPTDEHRIEKIKQCLPEANGYLKK